MKSIFNPDRKWPDPLPEKEKEDGVPESDEEKENNDSENIEKEKSQPESKEELEKRINKWEEDKRKTERRIGGLEIQLANQPGGPKREMIENSLNSAKEYLGWLEDWIAQSEEQIIKLEKEK